MKNLLLPPLHRWRDPRANRHEGGARAGVFWIPRTGSIEGPGVLTVPARSHGPRYLGSGDTTLLCIASTGRGWDHVSVSVQHRAGGHSLPTYADMDRAFRVFFRPNEVAMQLHVPAADHVNDHPNVLHLWRPTRKRLPCPPRGFV